MRIVALLVAMFLLIGNVPASALAAEPKKEADKTEQGLKKAIRDFCEGMASDKREIQEKALKAVLPQKKDVEVLFPKHADRLWPKFEKALALMVEHTPDIAKELARHRPITKIEVEDARKGDLAKSYKRVMEIIPKDIPLYEYYVRSEKGGAGGGTYLYVNNRWIFIRGFDTFGEVIDELDKGK